MIGNSHIAQKAVISDDFLTKIDDFWLILVGKVTFHHPFGELDDLTEGKMLTGNTIKSSRGLNNLWDRQ